MWPEILVYIYMYTDIYIDDIYIYICVWFCIYIKFTACEIKLRVFPQQETEHAQQSPNVTSFTCTPSDLPEGRRDRCTTVLLNHDSRLPGSPGALCLWYCYDGSIQTQGLRMMNYLECLVMRA